MSKDLEKKMIDEEYGKSAKGCAYVIMFCIVAVIALGVALFT